MGLGGRERKRLKLKRLQEVPTGTVLEPHNSRQAMQAAEASRHKSAATGTQAPAAGGLASACLLTRHKSALTGTHPTSGQALQALEGGNKRGINRGPTPQAGRLSSAEVGRHKSASTGTQPEHKQAGSRACAWQAKECIRDPTQKGVFISKAPVCQFAFFHCG